MEINDVLERIKRSAKLRLDWFGLEDGLIELSGTEKGSLIAENVLAEALGELSLGKTTDEVAKSITLEPGQNVYTSCKCGFRGRDAIILI